jgi:hypothetical protein
MIRVEEILEEENRIRTVPIKRSSVTRAINSMGYPIAGLLKGQEEEGAEEEKEVEETKPIKTREKPDKGPEWLQKYRERIKKGTILVDDILEEENRVRTVPIKRSSVTRAINSMGYPTTGLLKGQEEEAAEEEKGKKPVETREKTQKAEKGPAWLQKYRERIEKGTIMVDDILEEENRIRTVPIKRSSVTRAINSMGYPITGLREELGGEVKEVERVRKAGEAEAGVYSSSIGKISEETAKRFNAMKKNWEEDLGKPLQNDYFVNLLLALAKLLEHGKILTPLKK